MSEAEKIKDMIYDKIQSAYDDFETDETTSEEYFKGFINGMQYISDLIEDRVYGLYDATNMGKTKEML